MQPIFITPDAIATNIPADTIAYYSAISSLRPMYISVGNITYQLGNVTLCTHDIIGGFTTRLFKCRIEVKGTGIDIVLIYRIRSHQWAIISCSDRSFLASIGNYSIGYPTDSFYQVPYIAPIDRPSGHPTDIITTAAIDGKLRIDYIRYEDIRQTKHTHKVAFSHLRRADEATEVYDCEYISENVLRYITIIFDVRNQLWVFG